MTRSVSFRGSKLWVKLLIVPFAFWLVRLVLGTVFELVGFLLMIVLVVVGFERGTSCMSHPLPDLRRAVGNDQKGGVVPRSNARW